MCRPLVTIGLTTYDAEDSVERAVSSALAQTWRPIEIVAVDDGSTDGTFATLERLADRHQELRVFVNKVNSGVAVSRNRILAEARGEFVAFFDDDDESLSSRVSAQVARILAYESMFAQGQPVVCHTARTRIYAKGTARIESTMGVVEGRVAPHGLPVARRILMGTPLRDAYGACPTCSQMARLSTYCQVGGFDSELRRSEDTDLAIRIAEVGGHFIGLREPLVTQWMTRTCEKSVEDEVRYKILLAKKHRKFFDEVSQYEFCLDWLHAKGLWMKKARFAFASKLIALAVQHPLLTGRRILMALPNLSLNRAFRRFHDVD